MVFKSKNLIKVLAVLTLLFLGVTLLLAVGVSFARYQTRADYNIGFNVNPSSHLYLYEKEINSSPDSTEASTVYKDFDSSLDWVLDTDDQTAEVIFSNSGILNGGNGNILTANEDIAFKVRLFIPDSAVDDDYNISFAISLNVNGVEYKANNYYLSSHTPLAKEDDLGRGWVYYFVDKNNNEITFNLKGKQENNIEAVFSVPHIVKTDSSGKQFYVNVDTKPLILIVDRVSP